MEFPEGCGGGFIARGRRIVDGVHGRLPWRTAEIFLLESVAVVRGTWRHGVHRGLDMFEKLWLEWCRVEVQ